MRPSGRGCDVGFDPVEGGEGKDVDVVEDGEVLGGAGVEICVGETAVDESGYVSLSFELKYHIIS